MVQEREKKHLWWDACGVQAVALVIVLGTGVYFLVA